VAIVVCETINHLLDALPGGEEREMNFGCKKERKKRFLVSFVEFAKKIL
jgi:hypothetical protein